jgi:hypothetical protein
VANDAVLGALQGLPGSWDVSIHAIGRAWFRIDVIAPKGSSWSLSVPVHQGPRVEDLAEAVRAACSRLCGPKPGAEEPGRAGTELSSGAGRKGIGS